MTTMLTDLIHVGNPHELNSTQMHENASNLLVCIIRCNLVNNINRNYERFVIKIFLNP